MPCTSRRRTSIGTCRGPHFRDYHLLLDDQADQIFAATDAIAERVRKIGGTTLRSIGQISRSQRLLDNDADYVTPHDMLAELREDNKQLTAFMRETHDLCDEGNDVASASLLENWIDEAEQRTLVPIRDEPHIRVRRRLIAIARTGRGGVRGRGSLSEPLTVPVFTMSNSAVLFVPAARCCARVVRLFACAFASRPPSSHEGFGASGRCDSSNSVPPMRGDGAPTGALLDFCRACEARRPRL